MRTFAIGFACLTLLMGCVPGDQDTGTSPSTILSPLNKDRTQGGPIVVFDGNPAECYAPDWSPANNFIAFAYYEPWAPRGSVARLPYVREELARLAHANYSDRISISPDGRRIAYTVGDSIFIVAATGGEPHFVVAPGCEPAWSPDGLSLVFTDNSNESGPSGLKTVSIDDGAVSDVTDGTYNDRYPCWTSQGKIIFHSNRPLPARPPGQGLWSVGRDGAEPPVAIAFSFSPPEDGIPILRKPDVCPQEAALVFELSWIRGPYIEGPEIAFLPTEGGTVVFPEKRVLGAYPAWDHEGGRIIFVGDYGHRYRCLLLLELDERLLYSDSDRKAPSASSSL